MYTFRVLNKYEKDVESKGLISKVHTNINKLNGTRIDNKSISLKKLTFDSSMELNKEVRKTLTYLFKYEDSNELYGLSNKNGYDIITNDIDKKLELDKEKVISLSKKIEVK